MPRNISFFLTTPQVRAKTKTVTRRIGWLHAKVGETLNACVKCQGLKKGQKVERICQIRIITMSRTPLFTISQEEVIREGFPEMSPKEFILMFMKANKLRNSELFVTRIEFEYI